LSHLGSVTLLEAEANLAHHASGRSAALYEPYYGSPPVVALSLASGAYFHASGTLTPRGLMIVEGPDNRARFDRECRDMHLEEIPLAEALRAVPVLNPATVAFAARGDQAFDIDTDLLLQHFAREARAQGTRIVTGAWVSALHRTATGWAVTAGDSVHQARIVVNAAGAWADQVAALAGVRGLGFTAFRRSMARIPAPDGHDVSHWPMICGGGESWYAKPDAGALIVSPAEEHPMEPHDAWADDMVLAEGLARYEEMVTEPVTRVISNWAGLRTFAPDRVPVIGPDPREPTFFWLAGQGGYGFQTAPAASQLVADLIAGRACALAPATLAALSPARFG
jgi:glycine/D-amino acid oxidase-like deaminating enzyme